MSKQKKFKLKIKFPFFEKEFYLTQNEMNSRGHIFFEKDVPVQKILEFLNFYFKGMGPEDIFAPLETGMKTKKDSKGNVILNGKTGIMVGFDAKGNHSGEWAPAPHRVFPNTTKILNSFPKSYYIVKLVLTVESQNGIEKLPPEKRKYYVSGLFDGIALNSKNEKNSMLDEIYNILNEQKHCHSVYHTDEIERDDTNPILLDIIIKKQKILNLLAKVEELINSMTLECGRLPEYDSEV